MSIQNLQLNKCEDCKHFKQFSLVEGYCEERCYIVYWYEHCIHYDKNGKNVKKKDDKTMPKEILLCDNCRFADYKDNNDNFYCSLYDQQFFADPKHLVCEHHSYYCKGFDSPRYVK